MLREEKITSWYQRQAQPCWRLLDGDCTKPSQDAERRNTISSYMADNADIEEGEQLLVDTIDELQPGVYTLETYASPPGSKTRRAVSFRHSDTEAAKPNTGGAITDFIGRLREEREAALQQAREDFARQLEIHDLKRDNESLKKLISDLKSDNKELEKRASEIEAKKVAYIGQAVGAFSNMFAPAPAQAANIGAVNGSTNEEEEENEEEGEIEEDPNSDQARLTRVIAILREKEPIEWLNLLEGIARIATTNPETYNMARNFLIK